MQEWLRKSTEAQFAKPFGPMLSPPSYQWSIILFVAVVIAAGDTFE